MRMMEKLKAILRLPRKLKAFSGMRFMKLSFLRMPASENHQNSTRVQSRAASMEARIPMVRVTAKPLTVPEARQKRIRAVIRVVILASKIAEKAFS